MSWFQLDPPSIAARVRSSGGSVSIPSAAGSTGRGIVGFTLVSVAGFAPWAVWGKWFRQIGGELGMYVACAVVFIGLSGLLLHRLIIGPGSLPRFYKLFGIAFAVYSVGWILGWMSLGGHQGSVAGLLAGTVMMGVILSWAFDARDATAAVIGALFFLNAAGYFGGGVIEGMVTGTNDMTLPGLTRAASVTASKLMWGVCYGIGFGAGLGLAFYICQAKARALLAGKTPTD